MPLNVPVFILFYNGTHMQHPNNLTALINAKECVSRIFFEGGVWGDWRRGRREGRKFAPQQELYKLL